MNNKRLDMLDFTPKNVLVGRNLKKVPLEVHYRDTHLLLQYKVNRDAGGHNAGTRVFSEIIPRYISKSQETFEVIGLLQAEMGKTQNGCLTFCNHEYQLVNKVMKWFYKELEIRYDDWKWYIKVNINKPDNKDYRKYVENKVIDHWLSKSKINLGHAYPKKISHIKDTSNKKLRYYDYGSLITDFKKNLFSQIMKCLVKKISRDILEYNLKNIRAYMRGIIAGESNVEIHRESMRYRVYINANEFRERGVYQKCLQRLGIESTNYPSFVGLIVSRKENNLKLLKQKLMCLSPKKYNKFLRMMSFYKDIKEYGYFTKDKKPHNKIPQYIIDEVIELHCENPDWPAWKIAKEYGISSIKVCRIRKEHNLGTQIRKTPEDIRIKIAEYAHFHPTLTQNDISRHFKVHESVVRRAVNKYKGTTPISKPL